jgi:hypothetical protein
MKFIKQKRLSELPRYIGKYLKHNTFAMRLEAYYVFETDIEHFIYNDRLAPDIRIGKLNNNPADIDRLAILWPEYLPSSKTQLQIVDTIRNYMNAGDECYCATIDGEMAGMLWVGFRNNHLLKMMGSKDGLSDDEAIIHRGFVKEGFRGRRLHIAINNKIFADLKQRGIRRIRRYVGINNIASAINNFRSNDRCRTLYHAELILLGRTFNLFPCYTKKYIDLVR